MTWDVNDRNYGTRKDGTRSKLLLAVSNRFRYRTYRMKERTRGPFSNITKRIQTLMGLHLRLQQQKHHSTAWHHETDDD
jgi:hypothetical protein